jgi:ABC-type nickel/cobalt efflux system permease component RcnA
MTVEPAGRPRLQTVSGRPSAARVVLCLVGAAGAMTLTFTAVFVVATADEMSSPLELLGVIAALLIFWAPMSCWTAWYVAVPAVVVVGVAAAAVTRRYRRAAAGRRWRRAGHVIAALVLVVGCWTLILGLIDLASNVN